MHVTGATPGARELPRGDDVALAGPLLWHHVGSMRRSLFFLVALAACSSPRGSLPDPSSVGDAGGPDVLGTGGALGRDGGDLRGPDFGPPGGGGATPAADSGTPGTGGAPTDAALDRASSETALPPAVDMGCVGSACPRPIGGFCTGGEQCLSGQCVDGVCCDRACDGACQSCTRGGQPGICGDVVNEIDAPLCAGADDTCVGANACATPDQKQNGTMNCNSALFTAVEGAAQTFTVRRSGRLAGIRLRIDCDADTKLEFELHAAPQQRIGQLIASTVVTPEMLSRPNGTPPIIRLPTPVQVGAGTPLAFTLRVNPGTCHFDMYCAIFAKGLPEDTYTGGVVYRRSKDQPDWTLERSDDLMFETLMLP
jgi:hypothetical protein